jgi:hypothetical protein
MANNYNQATVEPNFPVLAVTLFERHLLGHYGFIHEFYISDQGAPANALAGQTVAMYLRGLTATIGDFYFS